MISVHNTHSWHKMMSWKTTWCPGGWFSEKLLKYMKISILLGGSSRSNIIYHTWWKLSMARSGNIYNIRKRIMSWSESRLKCTYSSFGPWPPDISVVIWYVYCADTFISEIRFALSKFSLQFLDFSMTTKHLSNLKWICEDIREQTIKVKKCCN